MDKLTLVIAAILLSVFGCAHAYWGLHNSPADNYLREVESKNPYVNKGDTILFELENLPRNYEETTQLRRKKLVKGEEVTLHFYTTEQGVVVLAESVQQFTNRKSAPFWQRMGY